MTIPPEGATRRKERLGGPCPPISIYGGKRCNGRVTRKRQGIDDPTIQRLHKRGREKLHYFNQGTLDDIRKLVVNRRKAGATPNVARQSLYEKITLAGLTKPTATKVIEEMRDRRLTNEASARAEKKGEGPPGKSLMFLTPPTSPGGGALTIDSLTNSF